MKKFLHINKEHTVYIVLWAIIFIAPVMSLYVMYRHMGGVAFDWRALWHIWRLFLVFFVLFVIHDIFLAPLLVYKHNSKSYVISIACLLSVFAVYSCLNHPDDHKRHLHDREMRDVAWEQSDRRAGRPDSAAGITDGTPRFGADKSGDVHQHPDFGPGRPPLGFVSADIISFLTLLGLLGLNIGVKIFFKTNDDHYRLQQLEKQNMEQQLAYLKYQISPHFFMNTLNNIHALVDLDPEQAKSSILELSKMMRYLLYEADSPLVSLHREYQFLISYVSLMRLRYTDQVDIKMELPDQVPNTFIPPLLTINFVENAFKHGVSYVTRSFIHIKLSFENNIFNFDCVNSKHAESTAEHGGVGLANARKRLDLLFGENYTLEIIDQADTYEVSLQFPMTAHK